MKLRRVRVENVRSFLDPAELLLDGDVSIIIGPNGGGKTNLLDTVTTVLRKHLLTSWLPVQSPTADQPDRWEMRSSDAFNTNILEPHSQGGGRPQRVDVELEVSSIDIDNIVAMRDSAIELTELATRRYASFSLAEAKDWDPSILTAGQRFEYHITNNTLDSVNDSAAKLYQRYLSLYEADNRLRSELGKAPLSMPMVSMPVNRSGGTFQASLSLASHNEYDFKRGVDSASSRSVGSIITMAVGRLASRYRILLEKDSGTAGKEFYADPQMSALSEILKSLGYTWKLECTNPLANQYDVRLDKQGSSFLVKAASSGEKELLTYLFAIYALNVRDALIVVDEPELHLHPQWQTILLALFEKLTVETGNQFLLATHSPVFVSPASIQHVSRVYAKEQKSNIVRIKSGELPQAKHLFAIVNSQNNERMFFADKVVLVEGISDRLFFDAVFRQFGVYDKSVQTYEIISAGGKGFFPAYERVLQACQVPYAVIADLDYINEIGPPELKRLFEVNEKAIEGDVVLNPTSSDGDSLVGRIERAIESGNTDELKALWTYIKGRRRRLRSDLKADELTELEAFIAAKRGERIFLLSRGTLEAYLPEGYASKDLDKLITLITGDFWPAIPEEAKSELALIAETVVAGSS